MKQAILIMAHNNVWTLNKIIECLDFNGFDIFVHIDKKSKIIKNEVNDTKCSNLYIYKELDIRWGEYSQVECEMFLLKKAMECNEYKYFHLISGADMPIKTPDKIYEFFDMNYAKEFICYASEELPNKKINYYRKYNFFMKNYKKNIGIKLLNNLALRFQYFVNRNKKIKIMVGANWFSITDKLASYVISRENFIKKMYKFTRSPDESFLQTIVYNSSFKENLYNKNYDNNFEACMRLIDWKRGNPYIFKVQDYEEIMSSKMLFVRKVDENKEKKLIEKISNTILESRGMKYEIEKNKNI